MKSPQLKALIKGIVREMIVNKNRKPDAFGFVNVEGAAKQPQWTEISHGFFKISPQLAAQLSTKAHNVGGAKKLPHPGFEQLVPAPEGFESTRGFVWLAQTVHQGQPMWSIRDAHGWRLVNGQAVLSAGVDEGLIPFKNTGFEYGNGRTEEPKFSNQKYSAGAPSTDVSVLSGRDSELRQKALLALRLPDNDQRKLVAKQLLKKMGYTDDQIKQAENPEIMEMTGTGAVAGYSTPFAFSKNKEGSKRGIEAAKKYGTVVKSIAKEEKK